MVKGGRDAIDPARFRFHYWFSYYRQQPRQPTFVEHEVHQAQLIFLLKIFFNVDDWGIEQQGVSMITSLRETTIHQNAQSSIRSPIARAPRVDCAHGRTARSEDISTSQTWKTIKIITLLSVLETTKEWVILTVYLLSNSSYHTLIEIAWSFVIWLLMTTQTCLEHLVHRFWRRIFIKTIFLYSLPIS